MEGWFDIGLWLAAAGHFVILVAAVQVPFRFHWKDELPRLSPANRKLFLTYSAFILMTIIAFGVMTLVLHDEMLRGDRSALVLAGFIGIFWTVRVVVDLFVFDHGDWPEGLQFVVGHLLLTLLFLALAGTYLGLVFWIMTS